MNLAIATIHGLTLFVQLHG